MDFLFQESLLQTARNVSARISLRVLRRLIWIDILRIIRNVGFSREAAHIEYATFSSFIICILLKIPGFSYAMTTRNLGITY